MRALVMAAGLGTRLKPLTDTMPKPLVAVNGRPMVAYVLEQLAEQGITEAILNIHYFPEKMRTFAAEWNRGGRLPRLEIQDESGLLLDSGGSVVQAAPWLFAHDTAALLCNADVLARPDIRALRAEHDRLRREHGVECTLAVVAHPETGRKYNGFRRAPDGRLTAWEAKTGVPDPGLFHFPGYYVIEKSAIKRLPAVGVPFGIVGELWKPLAAEGKLGSYIYNGNYLDLGTPEDLRHAEAVLAGGGI